jgi:hypothetical protein
MRILITKNDHPKYDKTGEIISTIKEDRYQYVVVLDRSGEKTQVKEGEFKLIR